MLCAAGYRFQVSGVSYSRHLVVQALCSAKVAPYGGSKIIFDDFTGDKTMASVSLLCRLTLNCKLRGRTKSGSALTVIMSR